MQVKTFKGIGRDAVTQAETKANAWLATMPQNPQRRIVRSETALGGAREADTVFVLTIWYHDDEQQP